MAHLQVCWGIYTRICLLWGIPGLLTPCSKCFWWAAACPSPPLTKDIKGYKWCILPSKTAQCLGMVSPVLPTSRISNILGMGWTTNVHVFYMWRLHSALVVGVLGFIWLPIVVIFTRFVLHSFWISGHTNVHTCTPLTCAPPTAARRHAKHRLAFYVEILTMNCPLARGPKRIPFERCVLWRSWGLELSNNLWSLRFCRCRSSQGWLWIVCTSVLYFRSYFSPGLREKFKRVFEVSKRQAPEKVAFQEVCLLQLSTSTAWAGSGPKRTASYRHDWCILWAYSLLGLSLVGLSFPWKPKETKESKPKETEENRRESNENHRIQTKGNRRNPKETKGNQRTPKDTKGTMR